MFNVLIFPMIKKQGLLIYKINIIIQTLLYLINFFLSNKVFIYILYLYTLQLINRIIIHL